MTDQPETSGKTQIDSISPVALWQMIKRSWLIIACFVILGCLAAGTVIFTTPKQYRTKGVITLASARNLEPFSLAELIMQSMFGEIEFFGYNRVALFREYLENLKNEKIQSAFLMEIPYQSMYQSLLAGDVAPKQNSFGKRIRVVDRLFQLRKKDEVDVYLKGEEPKTVANQLRDYFEYVNLITAADIIYRMEKRIGYYADISRSELDNLRAQAKVRDSLEDGDTEQAIKIYLNQSSEVDLLHRIAVLEKLQKEVAGTTNFNTYTLTTSPKVPPNPVKPKVKKLLVIGVISGLIAGLFFAIIRGYNRKENHAG